MKQKKICCTKAPIPIGPYSQAIEFNHLWFISGQIPIDPLTCEIVNGDIETQTKQVMENIGSILREGGYSFSNVIKATIYLTNQEHFAKVNEIYAGYFSEKSYPARSCIGISSLPKGSMIEIEIIARID